MFQLPTFLINKSHNMMEKEHKDDTEQIKVTYTLMARTGQLP